MGDENEFDEIVQGDGFMVGLNEPYNPRHARRTPRGLIPKVRYIFYLAHLIATNIKEKTDGSK